MQRHHLLQLQQWFQGYVEGFEDLSVEDLRNIHLKRDHTLRVMACMDALTAGEALPESQRLLAAAIALLHDVGRFLQYRRWRTFRDSESENHARLSCEVIRSEALLKDLPADEQLLIEEAVRFHNLLQLPDKFQSPTNLFMRLIRDADKLDIWHVFLEYYHQPPEQQASAVGLGFPDLPAVTPACLEALLAGQVVKLDQAQVLNDFKLLQLSWVYDLQFDTTRKLLLKRNYIPQLAATLPDQPEIRQAVQKAISVLENC